MYCDRNIYDIISNREIPEYTQLPLVFPLGIFAVKMPPFMFLSQHRDLENTSYVADEANLFEGSYPILSYSGELTMFFVCFIPISVTVYLKS